MNYRKTPQVKAIITKEKMKKENKKRRIIRSNDLHR